MIQRLTGGGGDLQRLRGAKRDDEGRYCGDILGTLNTRKVA
jgi:hypothetical protein